MTKKLVITGADGMLGRTLVSKLSGDITAVNRQRMDITNKDQVNSCLAETRPQVVIHCAAFTAVDRCETERDGAFAVNETGSANIAKACAHHNARLIAISTDYVFDGTADRPYREDDATNPRTVYGQSKLAGEMAITAHCPNHVILRVAWLYGAGGPSFLHAMDRILAQPGDPAPIVADQVGNPTSTHEVCKLITRILDSDLTGVVHGTCVGDATWYDLAETYARLRGLPRAVRPCTTDEFPRPAPRPRNSRLEKHVLSTAGVQLPAHWYDALATYVRDQQYV